MKNRSLMPSVQWERAHSVAFTLAALWRRGCNRLRARIGLSRDPRPNRQSLLVLGDGCDLQLRGHYRDAAFENDIDLSVPGRIVDRLRFLPRQDRLVWVRISGLSHEVDRFSRTRSRCIPLECGKRVVLLGAGLRVPVARMTIAIGGEHFLVVLAISPIEN